MLARVERQYQIGSGQISVNDAVLVEFGEIGADGEHEVVELQLVLLLLDVVPDLHGEVYFLHVDLQILEI